MRERIQIVAASAGSGKTYRLTELLDQEIASGRVRPEAVLATTFTVGAAAELRERARRRLLRAGRTADAQALAAARIGTVNAVCGRLVTEFAFELGLSPELEVLDEVGARVAFAKALDRVLSHSDAAEALEEIHARFTDRWDWRDDLREMVKFARLNGVSADELEASGQRSADEFRALWLPPGTRSAEELDAALVRALDHFIRNKPAQDATNVTRDYLWQCQKVHGPMSRDVHARWEDWWRLCSGNGPGVKSRELAAPIVEAAAAYVRHPRLADDVSAAIQRVTELAGQALRAYEAYKAEWGLIDFADQEAHALRLLRRDDVRARLADEIELVLIDEFQDTSPLQLAIFIELARIAPRSIWVGDQKQSIYAFRGTDPVLMDSAIGAVLGTDEPETLAVSRRSRPPLVALVSEVFAASFKGHDIPAGRVKLEAHRPEPRGAASSLERWVLDGSNQRLRCGSLAGLLADRLQRGRWPVVDPRTGRVRAVRPSDVAVLCRTNNTCASVAAELEARGVSVVLPRAGLVATLEGQLVLAGLALLVDPRDRLAAATVTRLLAPDTDAWLADALSQERRPETDPLLCAPAVKALTEVARSEGKAGAMRALELVINRLELRERCLEWGDSEQRLANLDELRAVTATFVEQAARDGRGASPAALMAQLSELAASEEDAQAVLASGAAVTVSTWHGSKGLEWPVVVLHDLHFKEHATALGVRVVSEQPFSFDDPLAGRWIRYWPNGLFPGGAKKTPLHEALAEHPTTVDVEARAMREGLRLMYVGWTRARDRLVLTASAGDLTKGALSQLADADGPLLDDDGCPVARLGLDLTAKVRQGEVAEPEPVGELPAGDGPVAAGARSYPPARRYASGIEATGSSVEDEAIGDRMEISGAPDMGDLGNAVHGFLAADRAELGVTGRRALALGLLERWGVPAAVDPDALLRSSFALKRWVESRWPGARWRRELPLQHRHADGSILSGVADLVLELEDGTVVIDHKSYPGGRRDAVEKAAGFAGQLGAYADALSAAGDRPCLETWVHLPVSGLMVRVERGQVRA